MLAGSRGDMKGVICQVYRYSVIVTILVILKILCSQNQLKDVLTPFWFVKIVTSKL